MRPASSTCSVWMKPCPSSPINCAAGTRQFCRMHLGGLARAHAELVFLLAGEQARRAALDDERGNAFAALGLVGHRHDDQRVGGGAVRDERLRAVQHPAVAVPDRGRAHRGGVAARAGLGQPPRRELLALARAARDTSASALRWRTSRCARRRDRCARPPTATRSDRRARALRCRCSSRRRSCRRRRSARETECPSARARPASGSSSLGKCCASSHSMTWGRISVSANSRTLLRRSVCSSVSAKSISNYIRRDRLARSLPGYRRSAQRISSNDHPEIPGVVRQHVVVDAEIQPAARCARGSARSRRR